MKKPKLVVVRSARELARALGLSRSDAIELEVRSRINEKIITAAKESGLTHAQLAKALKNVK